MQDGNEKSEGAKPVMTVKHAQQVMVGIIKWVMEDITRRGEKDGQKVNEGDVVRECAGIVIQALSSLLLDEARLTLVMRLDGKSGAEAIVSTDARWDLVADIMRKGVELGSSPTPEGDARWGERSGAKGD